MEHVKGGTCKRPQEAPAFFFRSKRLVFFLWPLGGRYTNGQKKVGNTNEYKGTEFQTQPSWVAPGCPQRLVSAASPGPAAPAVEALAWRIAATYPAVLHAKLPPLLDLDVLAGHRAAGHHPCGPQGFACPPLPLRSSGQVSELPFRSKQKIIGRVDG